MELHAIMLKMAEGEGEFAVTMPELERERFAWDMHVETCSSYHSDFSKMTNFIDLEQSDCSRATDRDSIHSAIRATIGFPHLNRAVLQTMQDFCTKILDDRVSKATEQRDEREVCSCSQPIALFL